LIRLLNICVIAALVAAAAYVYKIKFESTRQAERVAKLRMEIRREHDLIAALRAEWSKLDNPARIQELAKRHLPLRPVEARQFDKLDRLPERPPDLVPPDSFDPIGVLLDKPDIADVPTASTKPTGTKPAATKSESAKSATVKPPTAKLATAKPASVRPETGKSETAKPATAKPASVAAKPQPPAPFSLFPPLVPPASVPQTTPR
jgi:cell division protein FtsL